MATLPLLRQPLIIAALFSFLFFMCKNSDPNLNDNSQVVNSLFSKSDKDSIFKVIDRKIYHYKNIAFSNMMSIGSKGCQYVDLSQSLLIEYTPAPGEEIIKIRAFNDSLVRLERFNPDKYVPDTTTAAMFILGLELYKSNTYDSMALVALENYYPKDLLEEYKKQDRWLLRNSFKWVIPPTSVTK